jgi:hypothetical protein
MQSNLRPTGGPENHDRDLASGEILLITKILVRRDQDLKPHRFGHLDELSILQLAPPTFERRFDDVPVEGAAEGGRCPLIEEEFQTASGRNRQALACVLQNGINLSSSDSGEPLQKVDDGGAALEILEEGTHRYARRAEQPFSADLAWDALHRGTTRPIEHGAIYSVVARIGTFGRARAAVGTRGDDPSPGGVAERKPAERRNEGAAAYRGCGITPGGFECAVWGVRT